MNEDGIKYNYFRWVEKRFGIDKSFSPVSQIIKTLEQKIVFVFRLITTYIDICTIG